MTRVFLAASVAALMGVAPAVAQTSQGQTMQGQTAQGQTAQQGGQQLSSQDRTFVQTAAQGNEAEIQAGQLAETRAATPAVREFGRWMVTDHTMMNEMLQAVARHEGIEVPTSPNQQQMQQMSALKNEQGMRFDQVYINAQVQDHEKTVAAFKQEANSGENPILKRVAETALPTIEQHLIEARELQKSPGSSSVASAQSR